METVKKYQLSLKSDNSSNQLIAGTERENPQKLPGIEPPNNPSIPAQPDKNPDPTTPRPGGNEPEKNDPTRIQEPSK